MNRIFANHPMVLPNGRCVNVCFQNGEKIVSLSLDDSCGRMEKLGRGSIELHRQTEQCKLDIEPCTHEVFPGASERIPVPANNENLMRALGWLNRASWGFDAQATHPA